GYFFERMTKRLAPKTTSETTIAIASRGNGAGGIATLLVSTHSARRSTRSTSAISVRALGKVRALITRPPFRRIAELHEAVPTPSAVSPFHTARPNREGKRIPVDES